MPDETHRYHEMRRLGAVFACASVALLISLIWWIWVDLTPAWKTHQRKVTETRAALRRLDQLASGQAQAQPATASDEPAIRQVVLPLIRRDLHFTQTATTDRCMTCHAAINADDLGTHRLATRLTDALLKTSKQGNLLNIPGVPGAQDLGWLWPALSPPERYTLMCVLTSQANDHLGRIGSPLIEWQEPIAAHPDLDLYVSDRSPHPMKQMGCTVCHEGNGDETDFALAGHATGPTGTVRGNLERPMLPSRSTEASCAKCHPQISDTTMPAGLAVARRLNQGRVLVERWGCVNCHLIEGFESSPRVGPSLARANTTLDERFFREYVLSPPDLRPWTTMPQSFRQENNGGPPGGEAEARSTAEIDAMWAYLSAVSQDDPSQPGRNWPAELQKPETVAAAREQGRRLFNELGCLGCHPPIERNSGPYGAITSRPADIRKQPAESRANRHTGPVRKDEVDVLLESSGAIEPAMVRYAPDLSNIGGESRGGPWIREWLIDPNRYSPGARMPRLRLTTQPASPAETLDEATALAIYLSSLQTGESPTTRPSQADDSARSVQQDARQAVNREVLAIGESTDDAIFTQLQAATADNRVAAGRISAMSPDQRRWAFVGQRLLAHYGCAACHRIPGLESAPRIGPELTRWADKPAGQLDFGFFDPMLRKTETDERFQTLYPTTSEQPWLSWIPDNPQVRIERTHVAFAWHKLRNPRMWDRGREKTPLTRLRMPNFFMSSEQAACLTTYVLSRRAANVDASLVVSDQSPAGVAANGRNLARSLNCTACHLIDGNGAAIRQYYRRQEGSDLRLQEAEAPPRLPGHGARVTAQWTYEYLRDVVTLRPWLKVRMPSFELTDEQASLLAEYFSAVGTEQSRWLAGRLATIRKASLGRDSHPPLGRDSHPPLGRDSHPPLGRDSHLGPSPPAPGARRDSRTSGEDSRTGVQAIPPAADVLFRGTGRETTQWEDAVTAIDRLRRFALSHGTIPAQWLDPREADRQTFAKACDQALADAALLQRVYAPAHPFLDSPAETASADQIADGRTLFQELQCLQCHVFGDPTVPGANAHPTAPDLQRASRRLRRAWVAMWLQGPRRIQPGTRMPSFFGDGTASAFADYEPADRSNVQARLRNKSLIDDGPGQIQAIIAFVYDASSRRLDVVREPDTQPADN